MNHPQYPHRQLSVVGRHRDPELARVHAMLEAPLEIGSRNELADLLGRELATLSPAIAVPPATLDLIGHSMPSTSLLRLGEWVVDAAQSSVISFFRELADNAVLPRLGITSVRLLGCLTAGSAHARYTICALADVLGVEVYGTTDMICAAHYDATGFSDRYLHTLVASAELRGEVHAFENRTTRGVPARSLDLDSLRAIALTDTRRDRWPRHVLDRSTTSDVLHMIRRHEGAEMPGLLAAPACELALPIAGDAYVVAEVLLGGEFVRVFPRDVASGILYPVGDVGGVRRLVGQLAAS